MVVAMDETVGNITDALKQKGFMDNALLVFTTDVRFTTNQRALSSSAESMFSP